MHARWKNLVFSRGQAARKGFFHGLLGSARRLIWLAATVTVLSGSALGQTPRVTDSDALKLHYEKATAAYALGNFSEAAVAYEKAFELKPDPALLYNAAQAHRRAGNRQRAMDLYRSFLQVFPRADNRDVAERHLAELERALPEELTPTGSTGATSTELLPPMAMPPPAPLAVPDLAAPSPPRDRARVERRPALWRRPWVWIAVGVGVVVAGTVTAFAVSGKADPRPSWGRVGP